MGLVFSAWGHQEVTMRFLPIIVCAFAATVCIEKSAEADADVADFDEGQ
jgi:hypothetical protein